MSEKKAKEKREQELQQKQPLNIPLDQALQAQFAKVGQMLFQMDIMSQQLTAFEAENKALKEEIENLKGKTKKKS